MTKKDPMKEVLIITDWLKKIQAKTAQAKDNPTLTHQKIAQLSYMYNQELLITTPIIKPPYPAIKAQAPLSIFVQKKPIIRPTKVESPKTNQPTHN